MGDCVGQHSSFISLAKVEFVIEVHIDLSNKDTSFHILSTFYVVWLKAGGS